MRKYLPLSLLFCIFCSCSETNLNQSEISEKLNKTDKAAESLIIAYQAKRIGDFDLNGQNEFRVNTQTKERQIYPVISSDPEGNFVIVWKTYSSDDNFIDLCKARLYEFKGLSAQKFNNKGEKTGAEIKIEPVTATNKYFVKMTDNGSFYVIWQVAAKDDQKIYALKYDKDGNPAAKAQIINEAKNWENLEALAMGPTGGFIMSWTESITGASNIFFQKFDPDFNPITNKFMVNTYNKVGKLEKFKGEASISWRGCDGSSGTKEITENQEYLSRTQSDIAIARDGSFVITWLNMGNNNHLDGIYAQRFNTDGSKSGTEFKVNSVTGEFDSYPQVAAAPDGNFMIAWNSAIELIGSTEIYAQRFDKSGSRLDKQFRVNQLSPDNQQYPDIISDPAGNYIVTWQSYNSRGENGRDIFAQKFSHNGGRMGTEFQVNDFVRNNQEQAQINADSSGNITVTWTSGEQIHTEKADENMGQDGSWSGIYAKRFYSK